jgi:hypothetical protein
MRKLFFYIVVFVIFSFALAQESNDLEVETLSTNIQVNFDLSYSNEWWLQVDVSPANVVHSIQFTAADGSSTMLNKPSWNTAYTAFTGQPINKVPFGSQVTLKCWLISPGGTSVSASLAYNKGSTVTISNGGTSGGNGGNNGGNNQPSSNDPQIVNLINSVQSFTQTGSYPTAFITGEDNLRKTNKLALGNALSQLGINDLKTKAFLFAIFGLESEQMYDSNGNAQRDASKDHDPLAKNVSPLNMNIDMLNHMNFQGNPMDLNLLQNIRLTVSTAVKAINHFTLAGFLNFHRAGRTGWLQPAANDRRFLMTEFRVGVFNIMMKYVQDQTLFTDGRKVWANIPHV